MTMTPIPKPDQLPKPVVPATELDDVALKDEQTKDAARNNVAAGGGASSKATNPLMLLMAMLMNFIKEILMPEREGPDFDGERGSRKPYDPTKDAADRMSEDFRASAKKAITLSTSPEIAHKLVTMREQAEAANGGHTVLAIMPVGSDGRVTEGFGHRHAPKQGASTEHQGLDIASSVAGNTPDIISAMPGVVVGVGWMKGYGNTVEVADIYGERHRYAHLTSANVHVGDEVQQGQKIAVMGATGNTTGVHLHYEQRDAEGKIHDPVMMAKNWREGEQFALNDTLALAANQRRNAGEEPTLVAHNDTTPTMPEHVAKQVTTLTLSMNDITGRNAYGAPAKVKGASSPQVG